MVLRLGIFQQMAKYKWPTVGDALINKTYVDILYKNIPSPTPSFHNDVYWILKFDT